METINIHLKKIRNANYVIPSILSNLSAQKRAVNMLKWTLAAEIQDKRHIRERIDAASHEIDRAEQQIREIYKVTGNAVLQYMEMETRLTANAAWFE